MSLVPDYESSTSSSSGSESDTESTSTKQQQTTQCITRKLPTPNFNTSEESLTTHSVFSNPFKDQANADDALLQKHVKMVNTKDVKVINGKKICWNYRKGKCRFGHKCKYAHDSDVQKTEAQLTAEKELAIQEGVVCQSAVAHDYGMPNNENDEDVEDSKNKKRKRPGLTQGLVPGKKVMKQYLNQKL